LNSGTLFSAKLEARGFMEKEEQGERIYEEQAVDSGHSAEKKKLFVS